MSRQPLIGLADQLRALARLRPADRATRTAILKLLDARRSVHELTQEASDEDPDVPESSSHEAAEKRVAQLALERFRRVRSARRGRPSPRRRARLLLPQNSDDDVRDGLGDLIDDVTPLPPPRSTPAKVELDRVPRLLEPTWYRSSLLSMVSISVPGRQLDIGRIVACLARQRPLKGPFRKPVLRPPGRLYLLTDMGPDMAPYRPEQRRLGRDLRRLLGPSVLKSVLFHGDPWRELRCPEHPGAEEQMLRIDGAVVLATTWLTGGGACASAGMRAWTRLAKHLAKRGSCLVLLTPRGHAAIGSARWSQVAVVSWDRSTTPSQIDGIRKRAR